MRMTLRFFQPRRIIASVVIALLAGCSSGGCGNCTVPGISYGRPGHADTAPVSGANRDPYSNAHSVPGAAPTPRPTATPTPRPADTHSNAHAHAHTDAGPHGDARSRR